MTAVPAETSLAGRSLARASLAEALLLEAMAEALRKSEFRRATARERGGTQTSNTTLCPKRYPSNTRRGDPAREPEVDWSAILTRLTWAGGVKEILALEQNGSLGAGRSGRWSSAATSLALDDRGGSGSQL
jgi:hypothetical protein